MDRLFLLLAGCRPFGALPYAGTWASALTALLVYGAARCGVSTAGPAYFTALAVVVLLGAIGAGAAEKILDQPDPGCVTIDEAAGQMLALAWCPAHPAAVPAGFILFRFFVIAKPFPVRWLNRHLHGGLAIMLDDLMAGLYALAVLQAGPALHRRLLSP